MYPGKLYATRGRSATSAVALIPPSLHRQFLALGDDTHTHTRAKKLCKLLIKAFTSASQNICITESSAQFKVCGIFDRSGLRLSSGLVLPLFSRTQSERERWIMSSLNARQSAAAGVGGTVTNLDRKLLWNILKVLINQPLRPRPNLSAPQCVSVDSMQTRPVVTSQPLQNESARLTERPDHPHGPTSAGLSDTGGWNLSAESMRIFFTEAVLTAPTKKQQSPQKCRTWGGNVWYFFLCEGFKAEMTEWSLMHL